MDRLFSYSTIVKIVAFLAISTLASFWSPIVMAETDEGTLLRIKVLEPGSNIPIQGARVRISTKNDRTKGYTDEKGIFEQRIINGKAHVSFLAPPAGSYVKRTRNKPIAFFYANGGVKEVTRYATSKLEQLGTVSGQILLPDGMPASGVKLCTANSINYRTATFSGSGGASTVTSDDGTFELANIPVGPELFLYAHTKDYKYVLTEVVKSVDGQTVLQEPLLMRQSQTTDVLFTDEKGNPRANMVLLIRPIMWDNIVFRAGDRKVQTDDTGRLKIDGIASGLKYRVRAPQINASDITSMHYYFHKRIVLVPKNGKEVAVKVTGAVGGANEISGIVVDENGNPVTGALVKLTSKDLIISLKPTNRPIGRNDIIFNKVSDETRSNGAFRFDGLKLGNTDVVIEASGYQTEILSDISTNTSDLHVILSRPSSF